MESYKDIIHHIHQFISNSSNDIGILVSGGFDSAVLSYVCFMHQRREILHLCTVPKIQENSAVNSLRIKSWLESVHNISINQHIVGDPTLVHYMQVASGCKEMLNNTSMSMLMACTKNPDDMLTGWAPKRPRSKNPRILQPFLDYDKSFVVGLADYLGILSTVSTISHSCTQTSTVRCGRCWHCNERKWAFDKLQLIDIGKE
jgi:7-cyano-7-deazaguanine synthase in queuosine biosynthesis